uniref:AVR-Pita1 (AVR-Pita1 protein) (Effector protein AVR-Pita1) n=1 Tax=Ganoderma boninense TaxID=34458 RepID=A0A5K1JYR5_9APHY|nr:AVR-Pita1 (AVR-Pita1 protein) (Effector protein AVR-Pita1) [Ganoderma boninense]
MSKPADDSGPAQSAPLVEFLNTLPSPLTTTLVGLAPAISRTRYLVHLLAWKAPWEDSSLFLASWWALCLLPELGLRYLFPFVLFVLLFRFRPDPTSQHASPPVTEDILQHAIADLTAIHTLFTSLSIPGRTPTQVTTIRPLILLRSIAVVYIPYLALTYAVRIRILLALAGTLLLTWRARWATVVRGALWRSAHIRWAAYRAWSVLSGQPLPPVPRSPQSHSEAQLASVSSLTAQKEKLPEASLRFLFTIYENQRWWMGLDWTAALLPNERPSWCSVSQQPAAPPSAFTLPAATTAYTLTPDGKGRVKRVARWRWEEEEWRVVVRREGAAGASRVEKPVPQPKEESAAAAGASRILKKMRTGSLDLGEHGAEKDGEGHRAEDGAGASGSADVQGAEDEEVEEPSTDPDGWVYADNKWEGASCKGGMGKYTRFRRWTRIAVLTETIEIVGPGELGVRRDEHLPVGVSASKSVADAIPPSPSQSPRTPTKALSDLSSGGSGAGVGHHRTSSSLASLPPAPSDGANKDTVTPQSSPAKEESRLRQRLKAAVLGATTGSTAEHS